MFRKAAYKITQNLCKENIIPKDDFELYEYGFNMGITILFNIISTVIIGVIIGRVFESIAFLVFYIPLRSYAGGYHASTPWRCYFISIIMLAIVLSGMKYLILADWIYYVILAASAMIIFILSPVEDKNKSLDVEEFCVFRKRAIAILIIEMFVWLVFVLFIHKFELIIPNVIFTEAIMLVFGTIKNKKYK